MRLSFQTLAAGAAGALLALAALPGCDNPACVFGGDCSDSDDAGDGGLGTGVATLPADGDWVDSAAPSIQAVFPSGSAADPQTPVVVVFSESMRPGTTAAAFDLFRAGSQAPVSLAPSALIAGGRVLVLRPAGALQLNTTHELRLRQGVEAVDLNGQVLARPANDLAGSFRVATAAPAAPAVLTTFPPAGATFQSETPVLAVVFSRPVDQLTVDGGSFGVTVDGLPPLFDPEPAPLVVQDLFPITDTRVFTWQSLDGSDKPAPLGRGGVVEIALSPDPPAAGNKIEDDDGNVVPATTVEFDIAPFGIVSAALQSTPDDAINIANLTDPPGMNGLDLVVTVADVESADRLDLFLFGLEASSEPMAPPTPISLLRSVAVGSAGASVQVSVDAAALDLAASTNPLTGVVLDGSLGIAMRLRRGASFGPVTLLDVDALEDGVQSPVLDTLRPVLVGLGPTGTNLASLRSDMPDVVVVGRASEALRAAFVSTALGDNGPDPLDPPDVAGSSATGLFVAARVPLADGIVPSASLPLSFTITVYDRALNPAALPTTADYTQLGVGGPAALAGQITVQVFDAATLAPVAGARVFTHADDGATTAPIDEQLTDSQGSRVLNAALLPGEELIVSVDAGGYDLFTFHGVTVDRLGVPLAPTSLTDGRSAGLMTSASSLSATTRSVADTRFSAPGVRLTPVGSCSVSSQTDRFECPFGPAFVDARRVGGQTALATTVPAGEAQYSAFTFLIGFELLLPVAPVQPGATGTSQIDLPFLLSDLGLDFEETAIDVPVHTLDTNAQPGGASPPSVAVEALAPGVPGALTVGLGIAFPDAAPESWRVRAAYPGAVDPFVGGGGDQLGRYASQGTIEPDLFLRVEKVDAAGNRGIARPRLSLTTNALVVPAAPALIAPAPGGGSGGASYDLVFTDVLGDGASGPEGLYRVTLTAAGGRSWQLYRPDPPDAAASDVRVRVPDLGAMGTPLPDGAIRCTLSAFAWPGLDLTRFVWTDLEREPARIAHAAEVTYSQP